MESELFSIMEVLFVCNFPDAVTSQITSIRLPPSFLVSFLPSCSSLSGDARTMLFAGKVSKFRSTSSILAVLSLAEKNGMSFTRKRAKLFTSPPSASVRPSVHRVPLSKLHLERHAAEETLRIINPRFECCLLNCGG